LWSVGTRWVCLLVAIAREILKNTQAQVSTAVLGGFAHQYHTLFF
jgi:hypothetical protein